MITDALLALSGSIVGNTVTPQTLAISATTTSTNVIDLSSGYAPNGIGAAQTRDIGEGSDYDLIRMEVMTAFAGGTSLTMNIVQSDDAAVSVNVTTVGSTGAIPVASLTAGARFAAQINPRLVSKGQRYFAVQYVPVGTFTAGAVYTDFGAEIQDGQKFYPVGYTVS